MRIRTVLIGIVLACQLEVALGQDGVCTVPLDPTPFQYLTDELGLLDEIEFAMAAPYMTKSPVADGIIDVDEYANMCSFTYAENVNPGHSWPDLDNLNDGDDDLRNNLYLAHTDEYLFVAFEVWDDFLELDGPNSFQGDGVEIFMNYDLDNGDAWGPGKHQLYVDAAWTNVPEGDLDPDLNHRGVAGGGLIPVATPDPPPIEGEFYSAGLAYPIDGEYENGGTYIVEFQIPLASLNTTGDEFDVVPMKTGDFMLINTAIDDNDEGEPTGGQNGHHLLWHAPGAGSPYGAGESAWNVPLQLTPAAVTIIGDYDNNGELGAPDLDLQAQAIIDQGPLSYDLNGDNLVNLADRRVWLSNLKKTWIGDSNLDFQFNTSDFVQVLSAGKYETGERAGWAEGDWDGNLKFETGDLVVALSGGGYEQGLYPNNGVAAVPEPNAVVLVLMGLASLLGVTRRR